MVSGSNATPQHFCLTLPLIPTGARFICKGSSASSAIELQRILISPKAIGDCPAALSIQRQRKTRIKYRHQGMRRQTISGTMSALRLSRAWQNSSGNKFQIFKPATAAWEASSNLISPGSIYLATRSSASSGGPRPTNRLQINRPPQILGYVDRLIGLGQWPSVASTYHIQKSDGKPCLELALFFDKSNYEDASIEAIQGIKSGKQKIDQALFVYTKILNQLKDVDPGEEGSSRVRISLATTLMPTLDQLLSKEQERGLVAWVESIYKYLASLVPNESAKDAANSDDFDPEHTISVILDVKNISKEQIFKLKTSLKIGRRPQLVDGCLRNVAEVGSTSTTIAPWTGSFKDIEMEPRSLIEFSEQFTSAFEGAAGISFHISVGSDPANS